jgi:AcrR family transcriptional regulator
MRLLDVTERLLREGGLSAVTTQRVAKMAGVAEGTIYRHFPSMDELIASAVRDRIPPEFERLLEKLIGEAGQSTVQRNLTEFIAAALPFFAIIAPLVGLLATHPVLAKRHYEMLRERGKGPDHNVDLLERYLREEQRLGRVRRDVNVRASAAMIISVCFNRAFLSQLSGEDPIGLTDGDLPAAVSTALTRGLEERFYQQLP